MSNKDRQPVSQASISLLSNAIVLVLQRKLLDDELIALVDNMNFLKYAEMSTNPRNGLKI